MSSGVDAGHGSKALPSPQAKTQRRPPRSGTCSSSSSRQEKHPRRSRSRRRGRRRGTRWPRPVPSAGRGHPGRRVSVPRLALGVRRGWGGGQGQQFCSWIGGKGQGKGCSGAGAGGWIVFIADSSPHGTGEACLMLEVLKPPPPGSYRLDMLSTHTPKKHVTRVGIDPPLGSKVSAHVS